MRTARNRGFTLMEAVVAIGVLTIAGTGMLQLLGTMARTNAQVSGETDALALGSRLMAEIENAPFVRNGATDVGLQIGLYTNGALAGASTIRSYGRMNPDSPAVVPAGQFAQFLVTYQVIPWTATAGGPNVDGVDIAITIDNADQVRAANQQTAMSSDAVRLLRPIRMATRKLVADSPTALGGAGGFRW